MPSATLTPQPAHFPSSSLPLPLTLTLTLTLPLPLTLTLPLPLPLTLPLLSSSLFSLLFPSAFTLLLSLFTLSSSLFGGANLKGAPPALSEPGVRC